MVFNKIIKWALIIFPAVIVLPGIWPVPAPVYPIGQEAEAGFSEPVVPVDSGLALLERTPACIDPIPAEKIACDEIEQEILASTVRLVMYTKIMYIEGFGSGIVGDNGHATIKEGRYLITHNHYDETILSLLQQGDPDDLLSINVLDTNSRTLLRMRGQAVSLTIVDSETIVLDFGEEDGTGLFESLGLRSAEFANVPANALHPGMEVAQVDFAGSSSRVNWVSIEAIIYEAETSVVKTAGCLNPGASGGGLFWQGYHIGNNWSTSVDCIQGSNDTYSIVALNPQSIITP